MADPTGVDTGIALLRVVAGLTMAAHGYSKIFRGGRLAGTAGWFDSIGMRPGWLHARLAALTEIGAGLLLALGLLTSFAGAGFVALMLVAGWTVHRDQGFFIVGNGWEYNLILAVIGISIAMVGAGQFSLEHAIWGHNVLDGWAGLAIAGGLGVLAGIGQLVVFYRPPAPAETA
jgi:putative oxidoreductase